MVLAAAVRAVARQPSFRLAARLLCAVVVWSLCLVVVVRVEVVATSPVDVAVGEMAAISVPGSVLVLTRAVSL